MIPPALKRALRSRDGGCRFPGCDRTRFTDGHHVVHWADGGETKLSNLVTLCGFHHRLVHEGGFNVTATDDGLFVFTRPDRSRIPEAAALRAESFSGNFSASGSESFSGNSAVAMETLGICVANRAAGLAIDAKTSRCRGLGETMDYNQAIEGMQRREARAASPPDTG